MKKWLKFFFLSFFSHKASKESTKRDYANVFLGFVLALVFLWSGFVGGDMLPFGAHYNRSPDFKATVHSVFANSDADKRIDAIIEDGILKAKGWGSEHTEGALINTFERENDKQSYSENGYNVVVDLRSANTLAEVEAYCISNNGQNTVISYEEYLGLSEAAKYNFEFKLKYTGKALELTDEAGEAYKEKLNGMSDEIKIGVAEIEKDLAENKITRSEYNRKIYELYFENYYPSIEDYEGSSKVPLLRNYYQHQYVSCGAEKYLFIFDDYMTGSFETKGKIAVTFHGFYRNLEDGELVFAGATQDEAYASVDRFVKNSFKANWILNVYAHFINVITLAPFIALMLLVATLLTYSIMKLRGVESIKSLGAMLKIVGSYAWFSGVASAVSSVIIAFFVPRNLLGAMPLVLFFAVLVVRSMVFVAKESILYMKQLEQKEIEQKEE